MTDKLTRRHSLKLLTAGSLTAGLASRHSLPAQTPDAKPARDPWAKTHDRVFLGGEFWANPMEDWRVSEGGAECLNAGPGRSVHSLTHQITRNGSFTMAVTLTRLEASANDGGAGFRFSLRSEIDEHRSNCFVFNGSTTGWKGDLILLGPKAAKLKDGASLSKLRLTLTGAPQGDQYALTLTASDVETGAELAVLKHEVLPGRILGNVSLANNLASVGAGAAKGKKGKAGANGAGGRYRFQDWTLEGDAFTVTESQRFGPILWSMYSLSDSRTQEGFVMKMSALTGPLGAQDNQLLGNCF